MLAEVPAYMWCYYLNQVQEVATMKRQFLDSHSEITTLYFFFLFFFFFRFLTLCRSFGFFFSLFFVCVLPLVCALFFL